MRRNDEWGDLKELCHECGTPDPRGMVGGEPYCLNCITQLRKRETKEDGRQEN